jgi:hypothetical protein
MSKFTPEPGALFYADSTTVYVREIGSGDTAVIEKEKDRSFCENVFRCVAVDNRAVIADFVWGHGFVNKRRMLVRREWQFEPIGPGVAEALGLER